MLVRIRLGTGPRLSHRRNDRRRQVQAARAAAALLQPPAMLSCVLAVWRVGADMQWTREFAIAEGLFSHWQVWLALGILLLVFASLLNRYGREDDSIVSD